MDSGIVHLKRKIYQKCNKNKEKNQISHRQPPLQQNRLFCVRTYHHCFRGRQSDTKYRLLFRLLL